MKFLYLLLILFFIWMWGFIWGHDKGLEENLINYWNDYYETQAK